MTILAPAVVVFVAVHIRFILFATTQRNLNNVVWTKCDDRQVTIAVEIIQLNCYFINIQRYLRPPEIQHVA